MTEKVELLPLNEHLFGYDRIDNLTVEEWYDIQDQVWAEIIGLTDFNQPNGLTRSERIV